MQPGFFSTLVRSLLLFALAFAPAMTVCATAIPDQLQGVGIRERLGAQLALDSFTLNNEAGKPVQLSSLFRPGKPVILNFVYFECPTLCGFVLNGVLDGLKKLQWTVGDQFDVLTVSIDHRENSELAKDKKDVVLKAYGRDGAAQGWHFLTGSEEQIRKLADQAGFGYRWDAQQKEYAHAAGIFVLTPTGKISRVLFGIEYPPRDLRLALVEAGEGKIGTILDQVILFCFRYDPTQRGYALYAFRLVQAMSALLTVALAAYLAVFWRRQKGVQPRC